MLNNMTHFDPLQTTFSFYTVHSLCISLPMAVPRSQNATVSFYLSIRLTLPLFMYLCCFSRMFLYLAACLSSFAWVRVSFCFTCLLCYMSMSLRSASLNPALPCVCWSPSALPDCSQCSVTDSDGRLFHSLIERTLIMRPSKANYSEALAA